MDKDILSAILLLITSLFFFMPPMVASADPLLATFCPTDSKNYTLNSTFEYNLKQLLELLPSNTSVTGFYNTSIGEDLEIGRAHV